MTGPWGYFSEQDAKIISLSKYRNDKILKLPKSEFATMSRQKIIKQIKIDTEKFLKAGGVIQQIPEGVGSLETVFQDKN